MSDSFRGRRYYATSLLISIAAALLIVLHAASWGEIDLTSVALLLIFVSPWLFPFVKEISFPGGGGLKLRDVEELEKQTEKIATRKAIRMKSIPEQVGLAYRISDEDPNLALASIRMGLERSLRQISKPDDARWYSMRALVRLLTDREILSDELSQAIDRITEICNRALHQADVDRATARRVITASVPVFDALDDIAKSDTGDR